MGGSLRFWTAALKVTFKQIKADNLTTWAAALTYYGILSIFPGILVLLSALKLTGKSTTQKVIDDLTGSAPGPSRSVLTSAVTSLQQGAATTAGAVAAVGLLTAMWSASGYVSSFMQATNAIHEVPEGRRFVRKTGVRLGLTVVAGVIVGGTGLATVLSGGLARSIGDAIGLGSTAVMVWDVVKWPVIVVLISLLFAVLYWGAPDARHGFRWLTPGSVLAVLLWIAASAGFALYATNFGSYNKTYGSLAAVIVFLVWLWITNLVILLGAEFDVEVRRARTPA